MTSFCCLRSSCHLAVQHVTSAISAALRYHQCVWSLITTCKSYSCSHAVLHLLLTSQPNVFAEKHKRLMSVFVYSCSNDQGYNPLPPRILTAFLLHSQCVLKILLQFRPHYREVFFIRPKSCQEIIDFCGLAGPGGPGNHFKRWGAKPPTF